MYRPWSSFQIAFNFCPDFNMLLPRAVTLFSLYLSLFNRSASQTSLARGRFVVGGGGAVGVLIATRRTQPASVRPSVIPSVCPFFHRSLRQSSLLLSPSLPSHRAAAALPMINDRKKPPIPQHWSHIHSPACLCMHRNYHFWFTIPAKVTRVPIHYSLRT